MPLLRLALATGATIGADLHVDLDELLSHQLLPQPVAGLLQQTRDVGVGGAELHRQAPGLVAEVDFQAAQLRRVQADAGALLTLLQLNLDVLAQRMQHLLAPLGLRRLQLEQALGSRGHAARRTLAEQR